MGSDVLWPNELFLYASQKLKLSCNENLETIVSLFLNPVLIPMHVNHLREPKNVLARKHARSQLTNFETMYVFWKFLASPIHSSLIQSTHTSMRCNFAMQFCDAILRCRLCDADYAMQMCKQLCDAIIACRCASNYAKSNYAKSNYAMQLCMQLCDAIMQSNYATQLCKALCI